MTLVVDLQTLLRIPGSSTEVNVSGLPEELETKYQDYDFVGPLSFSGKMMSASADVVELTGTLSFRVNTHCARCLKEVDRGFEVDVEESFVSENRHKETYEHLYRGAGIDDMAYNEEDDDDEEDLYAFSGDEVDLSEALKDNAILALPLRVLCEEDCPGLCPQCGKRRDDPECRCDDDDNQEDSPFAVLKELL